MRFRFCGDLEAPNWLIQEMTTLSEISSVRLKLLVKQVLSQMVTGALDWRKVLKFTTPKDTEPDLAVTRGTLSAVHFVSPLVSLAEIVLGAGVGGQVRHRRRDARQGDRAAGSAQGERPGHRETLPRGESPAEAQVRRRHVSLNIASLAASFSLSFAVNRAESLSWSATPATDTTAKAFHLQLHMAEPKGAAPLDLDVSPDKFTLLLHEMTQVQTLLQSFETSA